jgi:hypothetical protein
MNNNVASIEMLFEKAEDYSKTSIDLIKLNAIDKSADFASSLLTHLVISLVATMFIISFNIGLALWIGEQLGKTYYGFFVVAGIYSLLTFFAYAFRFVWLKNPINNTIISQMLKIQ